MAEVITMLALSPTMDEGTIAEWLKPEGSTVEEGEIIAEVETDKATMDMESFFEGTVLRVLVKTGDAIRVGAPMAVVGAPGEDVDAALASLGSSAPAQNATQDTTTSDTTTPTTSTLSAPPEPQATSSSPNARIKASPLARRMAQDKGLNLSSILGTGPHGRIIKRDVESAQPTSAAPQDAAAKLSQLPGHFGQPVVVADMPDAAGTSSNLSQMRKTIAKRMTQVWQATPHFYLTLDVDMGLAMAKRKEFNTQLAAANFGVKISVNDMILKACAVALKRYPRMNVAYNLNELVSFDRVHMGIAVAVNEGLITPTIRDADQKSLTQIANETRDLATRARDKKLKPHEYGGSTFSLSNLGMYGIEHFQAVINPPEAGILAVGAVKKVPVVIDDDISIGMRMKMTLSCDHRAVDGALGAVFLNEVQRLLENPWLIVL